MAMKTCRECGHSVSSSAKQCPSCGVSDPYISPYKRLFYLAIFGGIVWMSYSKVYLSDTSEASTSAEFTSPATPKVKRAAPVNKAPADTKPFTVSQICRATIAGMFGREVNTIKAVKTDTAGVYTISYRRPADNQLFSFDCKLSDDYVIWRESGQSSNRWSGTGDVPFNVAFTVDDSGLKISELHADYNDMSYQYTLKSFK